jgi:hypothetical protein
MAHTPGPWEIRRSKMSTDGAFDYAVSAEGAPVLAEAFGRDAKGGWPPAEANARLIAAAPDMLAALKSWLEEVDGTYPFESLEPTRAAIAKAGDGTP